MSHPTNPSPTTRDGQTPRLPYVPAREPDAPRDDDLAADLEGHRAAAEHDRRVAAAKHFPEVPAFARDDLPWAEQVRLMGAEQDALYEEELACERDAEMAAWITQEHQKDVARADYRVMEIDMRLAQLWECDPTAAVTEEQAALRQERDVLFYGTLRPDLLNSLPEDSGVPYLLAVHGPSF